MAHIEIVSMHIIVNNVLIESNEPTIINTRININYCYNRHCSHL